MAAPCFLTGTDLWLVGFCSHAVCNDRIGAGSHAGLCSCFAPWREAGDATDSGSSNAGGGEAPSGSTELVTAGDGVSGEDASGEDASGEDAGASWDI